MSAGTLLMQGAAVAISLISAMITLPSRVANAATNDAPRDEVRLRDGRRIRGRILERVPGEWLVIEAEDGHRRTFAWDTVEEIDAAQGAPATGLPASVQDAWRKRTGGGPSYELRAILSASWAPSRTFRLTGTCSTGSGTAPVSMYGQTASDGTTGFGGGVGGRVGYMYRFQLRSDGPSSWYAFRVGTGVDFLVHHLHAPTGIPRVNGGLCSEVSKSRYELRYESSSSLLVQVPLNIGGHVAFGRLDERRWSGFVLGAAWAPSFVYAGVFSSVASAHFNPLGIELTFDFAVLHARGGERPPEPQVRVGFFFAPHTLDTQPAIATLSLGAIWY